MKILTSSLFIGMALASVGSAEIFNYTDFSNASNLTFNRNISNRSDPGIVNNKLQLLTAGQGNEATSVWYNTAVDVSQGFTTTFSFSISSASGDGWAFVLQNSPSGTAALGGSGGGDGFLGITNGIAAYVDNFSRSNAGIQSCGTAAISNGCFLGTATSNAFGNNGSHTATITYNATSYYFGVSFDNGAYTTGTTLGTDIGTYLGLTNGTGYVGFTGGDGARSETVIINNWSLATGPVATPEPGTIGLLGLGLVGMGLAKVRRR